MQQMFDFRAVVKFLATFGAGVVVAGFFLSRPVERPPEVQPPAQPQIQPQVQSQTPPTAPTVTSAAPAAAPPVSAPPATDPANILSPRSVRTIPIERPASTEGATTGGPTAEQAQQTAPAPAPHEPASTTPQGQ